MALESETDSALDVASPTVVDSIDDVVAVDVAELDVAALSLMSVEGELVLVVLDAVLAAALELVLSSGEVWLLVAAVVVVLLAVDTPLLLPAPVVCRVVLVVVDALPVLVVSVMLDGGGVWPPSDAHPKQKSAAHANTEPLIRGRRTRDFIARAVTQRPTASRQDNSPVRPLMWLVARKRDLVAPPLTGASTDSDSTFAAAL